LTHPKCRFLHDDVGLPGIEPQGELDPFLARDGFLNRFAGDGSSNSARHLREITAATSTDFAADDRARRRSPDPADGGALARNCDRAHLLDGGEAHLLQAIDGTAVVDGAGGGKRATSEQDGERKARHEEEGGVHGSESDGGNVGPISCGVQWVRHNVLSPREALVRVHRMRPAIEPSSSTAPRPFWVWVTRAWRGIAAALALGAVWWIWNAWDTEAFVEWKAEAGPVPFFAALAVLPAFGVPTTPFYLLAGATFGVKAGLAGSAASLAANLALCYWIARSGLRVWIERLLARTRYDLPAVSGKKQAVKFTLLVKLAPGVPTFVKHYALVLGGVPFGIYFGLSFGITSLYAATFVVLGESALERSPTRALAALAALALLGAAVWWIRRRWLAGRAEARRADAPPENGEHDAPR
jgi:uncharacterized membrane protein YdjX (TVP38/TMEM64 family)